MDGKGITALVVAITIGAVFFVPVVDIIDQNSGEVQIENETVTTNVSYAETYDLGNYDIIDDSETLEYDDAGTWTELTQGDDYTIDNTNGTVEFVDTGVVSEGDEVRASYTYQATDGIVTSIVGLLPVFLALLLLVPLASKVSEGV